MENESKKSRRGFAVISPELRREIASKGGKAAHAVGRAHEFTSAEAREAGRKGGLAAAASRRRAAAAAALAAHAPELPAANEASPLGSTGT